MSDWLISKRARATQIVQSDEQFVTHSFEMRNVAALCIAFVFSLFGSPYTGTNSVAPLWGSQELERETRGSGVTGPHTKSTEKTPEDEQQPHSLTWIANKTQCRTIRDGEECKIQGQNI